MIPIDSRCEKRGDVELQRNANNKISALSNSHGSALSLTSSFSLKIHMLSVAVVPLVITMQLCHPVTAEHTIRSDTSGLLKLASVLQKQIWKLSDSHCDGNALQSGCSPVAVLIQIRQSKEVENDGLKQ